MTLRMLRANIGSGTPPFSYQWQGSVDGGDTWTPLGTARDQQVNDAVLTHARFTATNVAGDVTSNPFDLSTDPPVFTVAPQGGEAPHTFEFEYSGTPPVTATLHADTGDDVQVDNESGYGAEDTQLALDAEVAANDLLESGDGEFMRVLAYANGVATVQRGYGGTEAAALEHEDPLRVWNVEDAALDATSFEADPAIETDYAISLRNAWGSAISEKQTVTVAPEA